MRRRPIGYSSGGTIHVKPSAAKAKAGKPTLPPVKVRCCFCGQLNGPLRMDGKPYVCKACRQPLFAYSGPSFDELMERVFATPNPDHATLKRLEALANGDLTQLEGLALREAEQ
jgi:hypothetical protein